MRFMAKKLLYLLFMITSVSAFSLSEASQEPVAIGIPLPLTGRFKEFGEMMKNSFEMSRASINTGGGIKGRPLELVYADDRGEVSSVKNAFYELVNRAVMLVGGYSSNATYQMASMAEDKDMPFLVCTASADRITQKGWKNIYRLNPPISEYTQGLEDFWIKNYKPKSMAIIYENSMYGTGGALRMIEFCRDQAIEIRAHFDYDRKKANPAYLRSLLAPLTREPPDVIYMISYLEDAVVLVKEIKRLDIPSLLCGGGGGFTLPEFIEQAGKEAENLLTVSLWSPQVTYPGAREYYLQYKERYGREPDYHGAEAYSSLLVSSDVLKRAESYTSKDIRKALDATYMKTPFGPVKFYSYEQFERQNSIPTLVLQIIDGKFQTIWPAGLASALFREPGAGN